RLADGDDIRTGLGIAEGIETALSVQQHIWPGPVWAACSAGGIARLPVITGIEALTIFADTDEHGIGLRAARQCGERWLSAGACDEIRIISPKRPGDWN